jgi:hypothetical protein
VNKEESRETDGVSLRLRRLEDESAIRHLHFEYCRQMDEGFNAEELAMLWTEDGIWDGGAFGTFEGRPAILEFFRRHGREVEFSAHFIANEQNTVDGDRGVCRCIGIVPCTFAAGGDAKDTWIFVTWHNILSKQAGRWLFKSLRATVNKEGVHLRGWVPG